MTLLKTVLWTSVVSSGVCFTPLAAEMSVAEREFTAKYEKGGADWGTDEQGYGFSGSGSMLEQAMPYKVFLEDFLNENQIESVVDFGCGDWTFSQHVEWGNANYFGVDLVKSVIRRNQARFDASNISFACGDGASMDLPEADLLLCKDVLQHLSHEEILAFLQLVPKYKHVLITNDVDSHTLTSVNDKIATGEYHNLDLTKSPYDVKGWEVLTYRSGNVVKKVLYIKNKNFP